MDGALAEKYNQDPESEQPGPWKVGDVFYSFLCVVYLKPLYDPRQTKS